MKEQEIWDYEKFKIRENRKKNENFQNVANLEVVFTCCIV